MPNSLVLPKTVAELLQQRGLGRLGWKLSCLPRRAEGPLLVDWSPDFIASLVVFFRVELMAVTSEAQFYNKLW